MASPTQTRTGEADGDPEDDPEGDPEGEPDDDGFGVIRGEGPPRRRRRAP
jgi:hypothetical protein